MKTPIYLLAVMTVMLLTAAGCGSKKDEAAEPASTSTDTAKEPVITEEAGEQEEKEKPVDLSGGLEEVSIALEELQSAIDTAPQNAAQLQASGKKAEEKWDAIEEQVEEAHPEDYKNIEESLYPLIDETKKDQPDAEKIKPLLTKTIEKLNAFQEKTASNS
ncbi:hypothetical protein [Pseudobacillus badius]|uniref:hypothetical protein n=1 Tax=Bacillus badius TaxID=1455 RepID=UPI0007B0595E|nr:hypothetical protein [Bacillus badius]KZN98501.1 hypothetical protein A4244_09310 [Bacillus badius]OCS83199.1 hypothetical protein A6M11_09320 [Bacillus badius]OVE51575.1 hypothetical protein B1A98_11045 [Bacillus badius]TDW02816.1 hypothetical protein B0G66_10592 [Bacillus badius]UAT30961.1 hypothetical protein K7T73_01360 [Bacillus badius]